MLLIVIWGIATSPFNWNLEYIPRDPVAVDAIPDIGENQQIVFTEWPGRSPQDIDDQISYPLSASLMGLPGVQTVRTTSVFGFSSIYIIFDENIDYYWSRTRILERLSSLPSGTLPEGVKPVLGPDATGLGQVFWYTLEGRDTTGMVNGNWGLHELRTIQDFQIRYQLSSVQGVAEVAGIGGHVKEYQIDIDPVAMKAHEVSLEQVWKAVKESNIDIGAKTIEVNKVEYFVRGLGYISAIEDLETIVVKSSDHIPIRLKDIAKVQMGPAFRRGALDKGGAEVVGGVVVARYGENPMEVIEAIKEKIKEIAPSLPSRQLEDGTESKVTIVPFYDRSGLIKETLNTLKDALSLEILITIIVIILMVLNFRLSLIVSSMLPLAILMCFIAMRYFHIDANIVALSGIAIAIGTMVDMGIVIVENIYKHIQISEKKPLVETIYEGTIEVSGAVITALTTTVVSFLPVFTMVAAEGKLFRPLAYTKSFALIAAILLTLFVLPVLTYYIFSLRTKKNSWKKGLAVFSLLVAFVFLFYKIWLALVLAGLAVHNLKDFLSEGGKRNWLIYRLDVILMAMGGAYALSQEWIPLGGKSGDLMNYLFTFLIVFGLIGIFYLFMRYYRSLLAFCLEYKKLFLLIPLVCILWGMLGWLGFSGIAGLSKEEADEMKLTKEVSAIFPGINKEFMPALDEGSFLLMPSSMQHSGMEENLEVLKQLDIAVSMIPEVHSVVGKMGRVESALDPAPVSMFENIINYLPEYRQNEYGERLRYKTDEHGDFVLDENGALIEDDDGEFYRNWREEIKSTEDIWNEIAAIQLPGVTAAPKLQPIETRLIMLQTGMRAPMGIKIKGANLEEIEAFGLALEPILKEAKGVKKEAVFTERMVGKPYLEVDLKRDIIARYGLSIQEVQQYLSIALGGKTVSYTVEGRERYPIQLRYARELRDSPESISNLMISIKGNHIPLSELADIHYRQGPQAIKSEDSFLTGYVLFDKMTDFSETEVVLNAKSSLEKAISDGELTLPNGVSYVFAGNFINQQRADKKMMVVVPLALILIFMILYFQFKSASTTLMIFSGIFVAFSGGFIMLWLFAQPWFMNFDVFDVNMRELFHIRQVHLSVAVWIGFIALFGIATDDGVVMATYLKQRFEKARPESIADIRKEVMEAGLKRIRPCLMTTATTILALLPILTSTGKGSDIMIPMAIPILGGMTIELISLFIVPVLFAVRQEYLFKKHQKVN
jgi:Cu(I)/Ag(I) efflux system membrane protein CusA/SilA